MAAADGKWICITYISYDSNNNNDSHIVCMYIYIYIYIHACLHGPKYMYCQWTAREGLSTYNTDSGSRTNSSNRINSSDISSSDNQVT